MKNLIFLVITGLTLVATPLVLAQEIHHSTLGNNGTSTEVILKGETYHISQSIGQASIIGTISSADYIVSQGFQQFPLHITVINPSNNDLDVVVYPNPITTTLNIHINEEVLSRVDIFLYDITGLAKYVDSYSSVQTYKINMALMKTGIYILKIRMDQKTSTTQIVKK